MNKKGFTLVELLAVIVILGVVMTIGSVSITAIRRKIDKNMFETKLDYIIAAGKTWGNNNKAMVKKAQDEGTETSVTVDSLIKDGVLDTDDLEPKNDTYACGKSKDGLCYVIVNNLEGNVVNGLNLKVYMKHDRVYACIYFSDNNKNLLYDTSCTRSCSGGRCTYTNCEYSHLNYYCE